jgi:hypothetical protein
MQAMDVIKIWELEPEGVEVGSDDELFDLPWFWWGESVSQAAGRYM